MERLPEKAGCNSKAPEKAHKLVQKGYYKGIWIGAGAGLGTALSAVPGNPAIGSGAGILLGLAVGSYLDSRAEKEGRVL